MQRKKRGFTLVELLVVITIIGMLVAILIPAVNVVREQGRQTTCMNNQMQLGTAILSYELGKRQLPGVVNQIPNGAAYSWAEAIFPNLDRADLWQQVRSGSSNYQTMRVAVLVCPDDPLTVDPASPNAQALLSYGVNDQFFVDNTKVIYPTKTPPMDRNGYTVPQAIVSNLKTRPNFPSASFPRGQTVTTSQTVMLGDRTFADSTSYSSTRAGKWTNTAWTSLAFPWQPNPTPISPAIMASTHGSSVIYFTTTGTSVAGTVVVVTYFDGHSEKVASDTPYPLQ